MAHKRAWLAAMTVVGLVLAGCGPAPAPVAPGITGAFPTTTPGSMVRGPMPTLRPAADLRDPLAALAAASAPTPAPDTTACPSLDGNAPPPDLRDPATLPDALAIALSAGLPAASVEVALRANGLLNDQQGFVRNDFDLTADGTPEVVVSVPTPDGGALLIYGCEDGRVVLRFQVVRAGDPPVLLRAEDINRSGLPTLMFATQRCDPDGLCLFTPGLVSYRPSERRFVSLLARAEGGDVPPVAADVDNDGVLEVIVRQNSNGNSATGPMRTGAIVYDWDGAAYVESLRQPDPFRFRVQVVQEADRAFAAQDMPTAARLYRFALEDEDLRNWFDPAEAEILRAYALYRLALVYAFADLGDPLAAVQARQDRFLDPASAPVYAGLLDVWWASYSISNNLAVACGAVQEAMTAAPDALVLLNRYGSRNPTLTARQLCPF